MADPTTDGRMIRIKIADSGSFASLSPAAAVLFCMIIPQLNSHGKLQGGPAFIKEVVCPKVAYLTIENIPPLMEEISFNTDMKWFQYDDRSWIHAIHFADHQKLNPTKIGKDKLPSFSPELVQSKSGVSPALVSHEVEQEVEQEVEVKEAAPEPFRLPLREEIENGSKSLILEKIDQAAEEIYRKGVWPAVHACKNKLLKQSKNERAILHALSRIYLKDPPPADPWAYCIQIMKKEDGNFNARDYTKNQGQRS